MTRILLADDVQLYVALAKTFLARRDYEFLTATRGNDALALIRSHRPELSIVESTLPGLDALSIRRELQSDPELADLAMIITTARPDPELAAEAESLGVARILPQAIRGPGPDGGGGPGPPGSPSAPPPLPPPISKSV